MPFAQVVKILLYFTASEEHNIIWMFMDDGSVKNSLQYAVCLN